MALMLIKEDGTGRVDANAYADVADGDAYHEGHLYATAWTGATADQKATALVMASRLIDSLYQFDGARVSVGQAMQWPRLSCSDPDVSGKSRYVPEDVVPDGVTLATCEMARELIVADRTAASPGEGLKYQNAGTTQTGYDKADTRPVITQLAQAMLSKFGTLRNAKSGVVRLVRT
jgi:hypothetical protein